MAEQTVTGRADVASDGRAGDAQKLLRAAIDAISHGGGDGAPPGSQPLPGEQRRRERSSDVITHLRAALDLLPDDCPSEPPALRDGQYEGGNGELFVVLRLDVDGSGVVSGDVYRNGLGGRDYTASVRTAPGTRVALDDARWPAVWQDSMGATATGSVQVSPLAGRGDALTATLRLDQRLNGLPPRVDLVVVADRVSDAMRSLGLEVDTEVDVRLPGPVSFRGAEQTFRECLRAAGFAAHDVGAPTDIPRQPNGWNGSVIHTVLHDLMTETAQAPLSGPAWELHLLMLSKTTRGGLFGIMFDSSDELPRQGSAVFVDEIRARIPDDVEDRKIIQTTVHELGHALNLAHRFERGVGRADSTSFMNYDWRYRGGNQVEEFWQRFAFIFDADELEFLRHAPRTALIPGGAGFHSVNYWADGTGGYSPYVPEVPVPGFRLTLTPPAAGPIFQFGQPVFLEVSLENNTRSPVRLPPEVLDPKTGALEILVQRRTGARAAGLADAVPFVPIMQRCFQLDRAAADTIAPGNKMSNNLNLTFGSGGFAFAEPGAYDLLPLLAFPSRDQRGEDIELIIRGEPLTIRVAHPQSLDEERDAMTLFRSDVGTWFALGGGDCLARARDALEELRERRQETGDGQDPVVAAIVRAAGIDAGRPSVRFTDGQYRQRDGDAETAARLLGSLDAEALRAFDPHTAEHTARLARQYQAQVSGQG